MMTFKDLKKLPNEDLEKKYDETAKNTGPSLAFFRDEIARRDFEKIQREMLKKTKIMQWFTIGIFVLTLLNAFFVGISVRHAIF